MLILTLAVNRLISTIGSERRFGFNLGEFLRMKV